MNQSAFTRRKSAAAKAVRAAAAILLAALAAATSIQPASAMHSGESTVASAGMFPWAVSISSPSGSCTGTLIHKDFVLTAAHCVVSSGTVDLATGIVTTIGRANLNDTAQGEKITVSKVSVYSPYLGSATSGNDLALLKLTRSSKFAPLRPANPSDSKDTPLDNTLCDDYGYRCFDRYWGTNLVRKVTEVGYGRTCNTCGSDGKLRYTTTNLGARAYSGSTTYTTRPSVDDFICAGDSGGAVFGKRSDGQLRLVAVHASGRYYADETCGFAANSPRIMRAAIHNWLTDAGAV